MKINHVLKSAINRYAHAEGIRLELRLKRELSEQAIKYREQGKTFEEIGMLLEIVPTLSMD